MNIYQKFWDGYSHGRPHEEPEDYGIGIALFIVGMALWGAICYLVAGLALS